MRGALQRLLGRSHRTDAHDLRRAAANRDRADAGERLKPMRVSEILRSDQHRRSPIRQRRGGAGRNGAVLVKGGLQGRKRLGVGLGSDATVLSHCGAIGSTDRHDFVLEVPVRARLRSLAVIATAKRSCSARGIWYLRARFSAVSPIDI